MVIHLVIVANLVNNLVIVVMTIYFAVHIGINVWIMVLEEHGVIVVKNVMLLVIVKMKKIQVLLIPYIPAVVDVINFGMV